MSKDGKEKSELALKEEKVLSFWNENKIFEKSLEKDSPKGNFVFYDGPPYGTGLPHYGHLLAGTIKDVIPRYKTMKGFHVPRKWGWDCHGLPIENLVEKELGLASKKDIEEYGVDKFNAAARESVLRYEKAWQEMVPRTGRFVDMDKPYMTMTPQFMESVWWVFAELNKKKLLSKGFKPMHLCPRCETTLANFEVNQGYKDVKDISITVKFELVDEPGTFFLAWTTTPWTLPGNAALAVGGDVDYVKVSHEGENFIIAKELLESVMKGKEYEILDTKKGSDLVGKSYKPLFDYYQKDETLENRENGWQVLSADFVTTEDGTGIVHIAPAFGTDDMNLGKEKNLPFIQHVKKNGQIKEEVADFAGLFVKRKGDWTSTDIEVIKNLAHAGKLFSKLKIEHSYPHCWRCDTPLINYASDSWFVDVPSLRDKLLKNNSKINWLPENIKEGRFGKWLEGAREWAVSRSRFWGTPLPVWQTADEEEMVVIGSVEDLKKYTKKSGNKYFAMRHGQAESNVKRVLTTNINTKDPLTEEGKDQVKVASQELKDKNIDLIFVSPFQRTQETMQIVRTELGLDPEQVITDERLKEINVGHLDGEPYETHHMHTDEASEFESRAGDGESLNDVRKRLGDVLYEIENNYQDKNILILSHGTPLWMLLTVSEGADEHTSLNKFKNFGNAEIRVLGFVPLPHNSHFELDLHRPYIDDVVLEKDGETLKRVEDVFDVWFDSGSMPYAQLHYPFENKKYFEENFPADFIAEGLDQTRGWFYTLIVLSTALFDKEPFKNVVVNGIVLAEDGKKMSKSLKNFPDPWDLLNVSGADAVRLFLLNSPAVKAEDVNFLEKGVQEAASKVLGRLRNTVTFYNMYKDGESSRDDSTSVIDQWILNKLKKLGVEVSENLETFTLDKATRPLFDFVDDLSTWYVRRSRDRFKDEGEDKTDAISTTRYVLFEFSKILAPFAPFVAEEVYQEVKGENDVESVHLCEWSSFEKHDEEVLEKMQKVREFVTLGLEARTQAKMKVRQPLAKILVPKSGLGEEYLDLIKDELNVKEVQEESGLTESVNLDVELTEELKDEGIYREFLRTVQSLRKKSDLSPEDIISLSVETEEKGQKIIGMFDENLKKTAGVSEVSFGGNDAEELNANGVVFKIEIK